MNKENYIHYLLYDQWSIAYAYYKEKFDRSSGADMLGIREFNSYLSAWPSRDIAFDRAFQYYEQKFNLVRVYDKNNSFLTIK
jgi:hypothetical protein